ncbi:MAG: flavodoxin domain-containing protein [Lachnospiraceae bacterium]|nr:flavodoxin domain-containing protein [Lachnospiraceae bacterium]
MKTLIIYTSQTGFTKKYAQWLADEMDADIFDLKDVRKKEESFFADYEAIVYAGWCMAGSVVKIKWFLDKAEKWKEKRLAVICVGGSPGDNPDVEVALKNILSDEQRKYIKAFYCQGGFDYEKMNTASKLAMKMFVSALKKKQDEKSRQMAEHIATSYDISDKKYIEPVVAYLKESME